jgi:hypothetical protein
MNTTVITDSNNIILTTSESAISTVQPTSEVLNIINKEVELTFTDIGLQGIKGARGESIQYTWSTTSLGIKTDSETNYVFVDLKGTKGDAGEPLDFEDLTEEQKQELRGDVGDTSTNYTNIFLNSLLN